MASIEWDTEPHTNRPVAKIHPDNHFYGGGLSGITGVYAASGSSPVEVTFFDEGSVSLAMRDIVANMGSSGAFIGGFEDSHSGARWVG